MSRIKGKDSKPELVVRRRLHGLGYRYRLHDRTLPGRPDIIFSAKRRIILVHGCFWHQHQGCRFAPMPTSNTAFWSKKFAVNIERDSRVIADLQAQGWAVEIVWECETRQPDELVGKLVNFLGAPRRG